ncbi:MAG: HEAT repeat domain-containing protein [Fibrobacteria bacterium]|nr:HEAT repeat domain-containing protein [Fibrobacteria bacterium]
MTFQFLKKGYISQYNMDTHTIRNYLNSAEAKKRQKALDYLNESGNITHLNILIDKIQTCDSNEPRKDVLLTICTIIKNNLMVNYDQINKDLRKGLVKILEFLDPEILEILITDLKSKDDNIRFHALQILSLLGKNNRVIIILRDLVHDKNELVRATVVSLLKETPKKIDAELLKSLLNDSNKRVKANTIEIIEAMGQTGLIKVLEVFLKSQNNRIRANALKALWKLGYAKIQHEIDNMLSDQENFLMRASACWVIGECATESDHEYLEILSQFIHDEETLVKENAIKAQIKIGGTSIKSLLKHISDPKEAKRIQLIMSQNE